MDVMTIEQLLEKQNVTDLPFDTKIIGIAKDNDVINDYSCGSPSELI
jgi:hypothetical protein